MKFTPQQLRAAFYKAAANIEARPDLYDFMMTTVGHDDCAACMWGHVGRALDMGEQVSITSVARSIGFVENNGDTGALYEKSKSNPFGFTLGNRGHVDSPKTAADRLRAFADHHWPDTAAPQVPDLSETPMTFAELMASLSGEVV